VNFSRRGTALFATGLAGALVLSACGGGGDDEESGSGSSADRSGQVVFGESTDFPENLFPNISAGNATSTANILNGILPGAFNVEPDFSIVYNKDLLTEEPTL
jgi:peptide/nickel transport system substrate-binding protein